MGYVVDEGVHGRYSIAGSLLLFQSVVNVGILGVHVYDTLLR